MMVRPIRGDLKRGPHGGAADRVRGGVGLAPRRLKCDAGGKRWRFPGVLVGIGAHKGRGRLELLERRLLASRRAKYPIRIN